MCENRDDEDDKTVSSDIRLMVVEEEEERQHNMTNGPGCRRDETEDALGVEGKLSATQSTDYPPKMQTKSRYLTRYRRKQHNMTDGPGCGRDETEYALGVESKLSATQSTGYPPKMQTKLRYLTRDCSSEKPTLSCKLPKVFNKVLLNAAVAASRAVFFSC